VVDMPPQSHLRLILNNLEYSVLNAGFSGNPERAISTSEPTGDTEGLDPKGSIASVGNGTSEPMRPTLPPEQQQELAASALLLSAAFSQMISLLMRSPQWKHTSLTDLEWLLVPALANNQFALAHRRDAATGLSIPVALVTWASVSDDVDQRLTETVAQPLRLKPDEWKSGAHAWIVVAEGAPQAVLEVVSGLRVNAFAGREVKMRVIGADGRVSVGVVPGLGEPERQA
jgi:hemolysin-activating ACP:hemolysin acyltransferase